MEKELPAKTLEQLTLEVKFFLGQTAQNIIEVGQRLIKAKEMLPHGEWQDWLKENFNLSIPTARKFMQIYERFGITRIDTRFQPTQMIAMLALPEKETQAFIEAKAAEGKPVEDMAVRKLREEIQQWKSKAEVNAAATTKVTQLSLKLNEVQSSNERLKRECERLRNQPPKVIEKAPADYDQTRKELAVANSETVRLKSKLDAIDAESRRALDNKDTEINRLKGELKVKEAEEANRLSDYEYAAVSVKLDALTELAYDLVFSSQIGAALNGYSRHKPESFKKLRGALSELLKSMN